MNKCYNYFLLVILLPLVGRAQRIQSVLNLDTLIVATEIPITNLEIFDNLLINKYENQIGFFIQEKQTKGTCVFNRITVNPRNTYLMERFYFTLPESLKTRFDISRQLATAFAFSSDFLILQYGDLFLQYKIGPLKSNLSDSNYLIFTSVFNARKNSGNFLRFIDSFRFISGDCYDYHPLDKKYKTSLSIYDLKKGDLDRGYSSRV